MHLGGCNKEDLHNKPLLLFLKVISVCMHVVFTCVCACACACSLAAVWVCRSLRLSWEFAGPLTDSLTFSRTYPSGFASILHSEWISFLEWFLSPLKCVGGAAWPNVTTEALWHRTKTAECRVERTGPDLWRHPSPKLTAFIDYSDGVNELTLKGTECVSSCFWDVDG